MYRKCVEFDQPATPDGINTAQILPNEQWCLIKNTNIWLSSYGRSYNYNTKIISSYEYNNKRLMSIHSGKYPVILLMAIAFLPRLNDEEILYIKDTGIYEYQISNLAWFKIPDNWKE